MGKDAELVEPCGVMAHMSLWAAAGASPVLFTQAVFSSEGVLWLRGKPLMLLLLSVVVPEQNNCNAFVCFLYLVPLSRPKATHFVWVYKIEKDIISVFFFFLFLNVRCSWSFMFLFIYRVLFENFDDQSLLIIGFNAKLCKTFLFCLCTVFKM